MADDDDEATTVVLSFDVGIRNLAFARLSLRRPTGADASLRIYEDVSTEARVLSLGSIDTTEYMDECVDTRNANKIPPLAIARGVIRALDAHLGEMMSGGDSDRPPDHVIIENQPCLKNPRMKSTQMMIFAYFVRRFIDSEPPVDIRMFQPRDKLAVYTGDPVECALKSKYARRKRLSVVYTSRLLVSEDDSIREVFDASKKKDDLADAYLQALTFLRREYGAPPRPARSRRRGRKKTGASVTS